MEGEKDSVRTTVAESTKVIPFKKKNVEEEKYARDLPHNRDARFSDV